MNIHYDIVMFVFWVFLLLLMKNFPNILLVLFSKSIHFTKVYLGPCHISMIEFSVKTVFSKMLHDKCLSGQ